MSGWPYNTQRWQRLRRYKLREHPLCELCLRLDLVEPATVVHHKKPVTFGGDPFPPLDGLVGLCASCHNSVTAGERIGADYLKLGCDVNGKPYAAE